MKKEIAEKILKETEFGYDLMSQKFSETRKFFWRGLEFIADYAKKGDKVLDFGCGNGRLLELIGKTEDIEYFGVDVSGKLIEIAKEKYKDKFTELGSESEPSSAMRCFSKIIASKTALAFTDEFFNTIYSIAVFHHFPSKKYREDIAKELYRVTKKNGHIIITVWNLWQRKYIKNIIDNWFDKIFLKFGGSVSVADIGFLGQLDWNDCNMPFKDNQGKVFNRYHHAFTKRELENIFEKAGFKIEKCEIINDRNILLVGKKS